MSKPQHRRRAAAFELAEIDALLQEQRAFAPAEAFRAQANVRDEHG